MAQEIRQVLRSLVRQPGFTLAALITLSVGIGANAIVFTMVNGLLLRPLPFGDATPRIVSLHGTHPTQFPDDWDDAGVSLADLRDIQRESRELEEVGAHVGRNFTLVGGEGDAVRVQGGSITPNLFALIDAEPALGRLFDSNEGADFGFESVVLLSHGLWQSRFGGDPGIIDATIVVNERPLTVVGVMPPGFRFPERDDMWVPYNPGLETDRARRFLLAVGRLRHGSSVAQARSEMEVLGEELARRYPDTNRGWGLHVLPYRDLAVDRGTRGAVSMLLGAVGLVLLIGCANLASLLLARGVARQRELAVRVALGAGRTRLVRQMLLESLCLGLAGGLLGTLLALWGIDALVSSFPEELPFWVNLSLDLRVVAFIGLASVGAAIGFGLLPALRISRVDLLPQLGGAGRESASGPSPLRLQNALVAGQIALSLVLLVGASAMIQSFLRLYAADPGFDGRHLLTYRMYLSGDAYDPTAAKVAFYRSIVEHMRELSGVRAATATTSIPSDDGGAAARIVTQEHPILDGSETGVQVVGILPGFFETLDVQLLEGRPFRQTDLEEGAPDIAIVNQALARTLWPQNDAGERLIGLARGASIDWLRVVGVAPDIQYEEFGEETAQSRLNVYLPYHRIPARGMAILVRAEGDPGLLSESARQSVRAFAPTAPAFLFRTMDEVRHLTTWEQRLFGEMFGAFAATATFLACLGVYGLMAYRVGRRTHEIGIRLALGASRADVLKMLLKQSSSLMLMGLAVGLPLAAAVNRALTGILYQAPPLDPQVLLWMGTGLAASVLLASYLPARRAARIPPMASLREE